MVGLTTTLKPSDSEATMSDEFRPGPSPLYLVLLRGEITPREYAKKAMQEARRRLRR